jgi:hypothetical protein
VPTGSCVVQLPRQSAPTPRTRPSPAVLIFRLTCVEPPPPDPPFEFEPEDEPDPQLATRASVSEPAMSARMDGPRRGSLGIRSASGKAVERFGRALRGRPGDRPQPRQQLNPTERCTTSRRPSPGLQLTNRLPDLRRIGRRGEVARRESGQPSPSSQGAAAHLRDALVR